MKKIIINIIFIFVCTLMAILLYGGIFYMGKYKSCDKIVVMQNGVTYNADKVHNYGDGFTIINSCNGEWIIVQTKSINIIKGK